MMDRECSQRGRILPCSSEGHHVSYGRYLGYHAMIVEGALKRYIAWEGCGEVLGESQRVQTFGKRPQPAFDADQMTCVLQAHQYLAGMRLVQIQAGHNVCCTEHVIWELLNAGKYIGQSHGSSSLSASVTLRTISSHTDSESY